MFIEHPQTKHFDLLVQLPKEQLSVLLVPSEMPSQLCTKNDQV